MFSLRPSFNSSCNVYRQASRALSSTCRLRQSNGTSDLLELLKSSEPSSAPERKSTSTLSQSLSGASHAFKFAERNVRRESPAAIKERNLRNIEDMHRRSDFEQQLPRRWNTGDVYAPHDLTGSEARKWKKRQKMATTDPFDALVLNPINEYKNFSIMSEYMTEMGRIKSGKATGLRPVNQRRMAKAIRRAIGVGLMPSVHRHPHIIFPDTRQ